MTRTPAAKASLTIRLVAREAGVSQATVSRAFSQPELLSPATIEKVHRIAAALGYVPNPVARALSTGRAGNIALILPDVADSFFSALARGAQARAYKRGYATFLGDTDETAHLEDVLTTKLAAQVDGFVLASPRMEEKLILKHAALKPVVIINRDIDGIARVLVDTVPAFTAAVSLLAGLGHRAIAYIGAPSSSWASQQRAKAVSAAGAALGLRVVQMVVGRPTHEAGRACVDALLAEGVTAALTVGDIVAQGIMAGLSDRGLVVPHDFSVVGCDDIIASTTYPPMTSVNAFCALAGANAVDLLLDRLASPTPRADSHVITGELVIRGTTGPAPAAKPPIPRKTRAPRARTTTLNPSSRK